MGTDRWGERVTMGNRWDRALEQEKGTLKKKGRGRAGEELL
jgi:hypothetical protein